jgi:hypothetical protein
MAYAKNAELKSIGDALDNLIRLRNRACYELAPHPDFASATKAHNSITQSVNALAILDASAALLPSRPCRPNPAQNRERNRGESTQAPLTLRASIITLTSFDLRN